MTTIKEMVEAAIMQQPEKMYHGIHASGVGGCPRVMYYKIRGVKATTPPGVAAMLTFQIGHAVEAGVYDLIKSSGVPIKRWTDEDEPWHDPKLNLFGTPDYTMEIDGKAVIVDSKSMASKWFWYRSKAVDMNYEKEFHDYRLQQAAYLMLAEAMGKSFDHARLFFVSKDDGVIGFEQGIRLTDEYRKEITDFCNTVNAALKAGTPPECTCGGWKKGYCGYGNPETREKNKTGKMVSTECCGTPEEIEQWRVSSQLDKG